MRCKDFADGKLLDGDELIVVQGGGNDAFGFVATGGLLGNDPATAAANIAANIAVLASAGGEVFVVPNLGKSGQIPLIQLQFPDVAPLLDDWTFAVLFATTFWSFPREFSSLTASSF